VKARIRIRIQFLGWNRISIADADPEHCIWYHEFFKIVPQELKPSSSVSDLFNVDPDPDPCLDKIEQEFV
jgi:hypothetical protein